jgi:hypothetical protein
MFRALLHLIQCVNTSLGIYKVCDAVESTLVLVFYVFDMSLTEYPKRSGPDAEIQWLINEDQCATTS